MRYLPVLLAFLIIFCSCNEQTENKSKTILHKNNIIKGSPEWQYLQKNATFLHYDKFFITESEYNIQTEYYLPEGDSIRYYYDQDFLTIQRYMIMNDSNQKILPYIIEKDNKVYISHPVISDFNTKRDSINNKKNGTKAYVEFNFWLPLPKGFKSKQFVYIDRKINILEKQIKTYTNETVNKIFSNYNCVTNNDAETFLRVFKHERVMELWSKEKHERRFTHLKDYDFCAFIGDLGPKREDNDNQTPEGFYSTTKYRPYSYYVRTIGFNYPNKSDSILGDPFYKNKMMAIHGSCVTLGCISIQDSCIKELFDYVICSLKAGQRKIPVHIFPCKMNENGMSMLERNFGDNPELMSFWLNIKEGYDYFERKKELPVITVNSKGKYLFNE